MINNAVLDVAIGLIFIYLLYSLLATTIKEVVATLFAYRGRMLERGLEQMLDGENYSYYWWNKLFHICVILFSKDTWTTIWSKIPKKNIWGTIGYLFNSLFIDKKTIKRIHKKAAATCGSHSKTIVNQSKLCKKNSLFAAKVTGHELYTRSSEQSMLSKKPAYLASDTFSDILIDLLTPAGNKNVLLKDIAEEIKRQAGNSAEPLKAELAGILNIYVAQANGDLQRFKLIVEKWYDDTMDRVSGWYKKQASRILLIIGMILAVMFNVSTIEIVQKLSGDKDLREAMVKSASDYIKAHPNGVNNSSNATENSPTAPNDTDNGNTGSNKDNNSIAKKKADTLAKTEKKVEKPTTGTQPTQQSTGTNASVKTKNDTTPTLATIKEGVKNIQGVYEDIQQPSVTLGLGWGDYGFKDDSIKWADKYMSILIGDIRLAKDPKKLAEIIGPKPTRDNCRCLTLSDLKADSTKWRTDSLSAVCGDLVIAKDNKMLAKKIGDQPKQDDFWYKVWYVLTHMWSGKRLIGFIITALAISLGAPFWFDLLNKFINLRAAGNKPDDKTAGTSKTAALNQKPGVNSFA